MVVCLFLSSAINQLSESLKQTILIQSIGKNDSSFKETMDYIQKQVRGNTWHYTIKYEIIKTWKHWNTLVCLKWNISSDIIRLQEKCCGWEGEEDWKNSIPCSCYYEGNDTEAICAKCLQDYNITEFSCKTYNQVQCQL